MKNRVRKHKKDGHLDLSSLVTEWALKHDQMHVIPDLDHPVWDAAMYYIKDYREVVKASERNTRKIMKEAAHAKEASKKGRKKNAGKAA